jgi:hypothetical protein
VLVVLAHVAQDVRELHGHAEVVGQRSMSVPISCGEDGQAQPADRSGHIAAVHHELVEGLVPGVAHVELHAVDQELERVERQVEAPVGICQRNRHRIPGRRSGARGAVGAVRDSGQACPLRRKRGKLRRPRVVAIADVVHPACERVHRAHRQALFPWQQTDPVVEVRRGHTGDLLAGAVGVLDFEGGHRDHRPTNAFT